MPAWIEPVLKIVGVASDIASRMRGDTAANRALAVEKNKLRLERWIFERAKERAK